MQNFYRYYSNAFPSAINSQRSKDPVDLNDLLFPRFVDYLFFSLDMKGTEENIPVEYTLKKPAHIFVDIQDDRLDIGISWDKAVRGNTMTLWMLNPMVPMSYVASHELGINIDLILHMSVKKLNSYMDYWDVMASMNDFIQVPNALNFYKSQNYLKSSSPDKLDYDKILEYETEDKSFNNFIEEIYQDYKKQVEDKMHIMNIDPIFHARDLMVDDTLVFGVLPFNDERIDLFDKVIKPKLENDLGLNVVKSGDRQVTNTEIMETIWQLLNQSRFVIVDISDKNPNVFYELGICHTIGKETIMICDKKSIEKDYDGKFPFDITNRPIIMYENSGSSVNKLANDVIKQAKVILGKDK